MRNTLLNREVLVCADSITRSWGGQPDDEMLHHDDRAFCTLWYSRYGIE
jgi:hypothetical protein